MCCCSFGRIVFAICHLLKLFEFVCQRSVVARFKPELKLSLVEIFPLNLIDRVCFIPHFLSIFVLRMKETIIPDMMTFIVFLITNYFNLCCDSYVQV